MKLMTYNILDGGVGRIDPLAEAIRLAGADVVVVEESTDEEWFVRLAQRLGMDHFMARHPKNAEAATGLLSRWSIREAVNHAVLDSRITRSMFHAVVARGGIELPIIGVHLHPREAMADEETRLSELPAIFDIARLFAGRGHVICGDFNASHPQQEIDLTKLRPKSRERIASQNNELPRSVVRRMLEHGYQDAHALHFSPREYQTSFTTSHPAMRVDYIFVSPDLAPKVRSCEVFKAEIGRFASDHYPVVAEMEL